MRAFQSVQFVENINMRNKSLFFFILLSFPIYLFGNRVEEGIKRLSLDERICMHAFFDQAMRQDQAAHVLFFENKSAALIGPVIRHPHKTSQDVLSLRGWHAFKQHEFLFPHPNFIFSESVVDFGKDCKVLHIYIINKKSLTICLDTHFDLLKK